MRRDATAPAKTWCQGKNIWPGAYEIDHWHLEQEFRRELVDWAGVTRIHGISRLGTVWPSGIVRSQRAGPDDLMCLMV
jgi:hypothetical protein